MTCMIPRALAAETIELLNPLSCQAIAAASEGETPYWEAIDPTSPALSRALVGPGLARGTTGGVGSGARARGGARGAGVGRLGRRGAGRSGPAGRQLEQRAHEQRSAGIDAVHGRHR